MRSFERLEFEWAFGASADEEMEKYAEKLLVNINSSGSAEEQLTGIINADENWKGMGDLDREELLVHLESHLKELSEKLHISEEHIEEAIELRKLRLARNIGRKDPKALKMLREHDRRFDKELKKHDSKLYEKLLAHRREALDNLRKTNPEFSDLIDELSKQ